MEAVALVTGKDKPVPVEPIALRTGLVSMMFETYAVEPLLRLAACLACAASYQLSQ